MRTSTYLHIGTNKTGTTAIQRWLTEHREELKNRGLLYPSAGMPFQAHHSLAHALGFHWLRPAADEDQAARFRRELDSEVRATNPRLVLISSENFCITRPMDAVRSFFRAMDVRIVVYLRRHDVWWQSAYTQAVKMVAAPPFQCGFESFLNFRLAQNRNSANYRKLIDRWANAFGKENIIVRPYEPCQNQPNIVADFLRAIECPELANNMSAPNERVNEKPSVIGLQLAEVFQRADIEADLRRRLVADAFDLTPPEGPAASVISPSLRSKLVDDNWSDYEYIAREFLDRKDGRLFMDSRPDASESWEGSEPLSSSFIVTETIKALAATNSGDESPS
jgi:hypothetical protein